MPAKEIYDIDDFKLREEFNNFFIKQKSCQYARNFLDCMRQGQVGDCYLLASLYALVCTNEYFLSEMLSRFYYHKDNGTIIITLNGNKYSSNVLKQDTQMLNSKGIYFDQKEGFDIWTLEVEKFNLEKGARVRSRSFRLLEHIVPMYFDHHIQSTNEPLLPIHELKRLPTYHDEVRLIAWLFGCTTDDLTIQEAYEFKRKDKELPIYVAIDWGPQRDRHALYFEEVVGCSSVVLVNPHNPQILENYTFAEIGNRKPLFILFNTSHLQERNRILFFKAQKQLNSDGFKNISDAKQRLQEIKIRAKMKDNLISDPLEKHFYNTLLKMIKEDAESYIKAIDEAKRLFDDKCDSLGNITNLQERLSEIDKAISEVNHENKIKQEHYSNLLKEEKNRIEVAIINVKQYFDEQFANITSLTVRLIKIGSALTTVQLNTIPSDLDRAYYIELLHKEQKIISGAIDSARRRLDLNNFREDPIKNRLQKIIYVLTQVKTEEGKKVCNFDELERASYIELLYEEQVNVESAILKIEKNAQLQFNAHKFYQYDLIQRKAIVEDILKQISKEMKKAIDVTEQHDNSKEQRAHYIELLHNEKTKINKTIAKAEKDAQVRFDAHEFNKYDLLSRKEMVEEALMQIDKEKAPFRDEQYFVNQATIECYVELLLNEQKMVEGAIFKITQDAQKRFDENKFYSEKFNSQERLSKINDALKDVCNSVILNELERTFYVRLLQEAKSKEVEAKDFEDKKKVFIEASQYIISMDKQDLIMFLGNTGSGVSTLINYCLGHTLKKKNNRYDQPILTLENEDDLRENDHKYAKIGHSIGTNVTRFIQGYKSEKTKEINQNLCLVDCPVFSYIYGIEINKLAVLHSFDQIIANANSIKAIVLTVTFDAFIHNNAIQVINLFEWLLKKIPLALNRTEIKNSIFLAITKHGMYTKPKEIIRKILHNLHEEEKDKSTILETQNAKQNDNREQLRLLQLRRIEIWQMALDIVNNRAYCIATDNKIARIKILQACAKAPGIPKETFTTISTQYTSVYYLPMQKEIQQHAINHGIPLNAEGGNFLPIKEEEYEEGISKNMHKLRI